MTLAVLAAAEIPSAGVKTLELARAKLKVPPAAIRRQTAQREQADEGLPVPIWKDGLAETELAEGQHADLLADAYFWSATVGRVSEAFNKRAPCAQAVIRLGYACFVCQNANRA